ncbi:MAG: arginine N-succinyltransferase [Gammaproteobacteria bacterium]|nr:MAG: arginine N-succinyltransferase [Gammaproteobacteria bacterium]
MSEEVVEENKENRGCLRTLGIMLATVVISVAVTVFVVTHYLFPKQFDPVELSQHEETVLNKKLRQFGLPTLSSEKVESKSIPIEPEAYSEAGAKREVDFSEKELNAMLAKNSDLADKMAIDLSESLASIKMIIPLDPDFPFLGGKTLKVNAGAELGYTNGRPVVVLKGVSVWGVPVPNAWLGNLKNVDLVGEFGGDEGFWKSFADGVENIHVEEGNLKIKFKE